MMNFVLYISLKQYQVNKKLTNVILNVISFLIIVKYLVTCLDAGEQMV